MHKYRQVNVKYKKTNYSESPCIFLFAKTLLCKLFIKKKSVDANSPTFFNYN